METRKIKSRFLVRCYLSLYLLLLVEKKCRSVKNQMFHYKIWKSLIYKTEWLPALDKTAGHQERMSQFLRHSRRKQEGTFL